MPTALDPRPTIVFRPARKNGLISRLLVPALIFGACVVAILLLGGGHTVAGNANLILQNTEIDWASAAM